MQQPQPPVLPSGLPALDALDLTHKKAVQDYLIDRIQACPQGNMPFEQWMGLALYAPGLGYYTAGNEKLASTTTQGDFTTAPELSPLFGQTLARQIAQVLKAVNSINVLEFGAGSGALAASVIPALKALGIEPNYQILDVSADLQQRQQQRLAPYHDNVSWLTELPKTFTGCVLANEVLDAMPATLFRWSDDGNLMELGVAVANGQQTSAPDTDGDGDGDGDGDTISRTIQTHAPDCAETPFFFTERTASPELQALVSACMPCLPGYQSEVNRQAEAWVRQMGEWLVQGAALLVDYGFPQREYYHPQRADGTLMCHFRHHSHSQPLVYAGLQDITTHVDFTAMADAALEGGLDVMGYTSQARFLINCGLTDVMEDAKNQTRQQQAAATSANSKTLQNYSEGLSGVQKLVSEAEMGELFKVLAVARGLDAPLLGFANGDRRHRL